MNKPEQSSGTAGITGAKGLLGSALMRVIDNPVEITADIRDIDALQRELAAKNPSVVIHTAAITDVAACERDPDTAFAVNAMGTKNIVDAAERIGARVLYVSTASVFDGDRGDYRETDAPNPQNIYNVSKVRGEEYVRTYRHGTTVRLNLIGIHPDGSRRKNFLEWLVDSFRADKNIDTFEDVMVNPLSNWTIAELVRKIIEIASDEPVLHLSSSDVMSKADIAEIVAARFPAYRGTLRRTSVDSITDGVKRPKEMWLNADYTARVLGITMPSMSEEIDRIFKHYRV